MELQEFVTQSLLSIINGVRDAQKSEGGTSINPKFYTIGDRAGYAYRVEGDKLAWHVSFDVAVDVSENRAADGGAKISIFSASVGADVHAANETRTASRLTFKVPICLPHHEASTK